MKRYVLAGIAWALTVLSFSLGVPNARAQDRPEIHHEAVVFLHPETGSITIDDMITVEGRERLSLDIADWLTIDSIEAETGAPEVLNRGRRAEVVFEQPGPNTLTVRLSGTVPTETGSRTGTGPLGAYLFGSSGWLPESGDRTLSFEIDISVPAPFRAVATGSLTNEEVTDTSYTARFKSALAYDRPALFAGPYSIQERMANGVRLRTYFHDGLADFSESYLTSSQAYIERYSRSIGGYPFDDFLVVSASLPVGLAFPNLTYIDKRIVPLPFMQGRSLAHEILHNWWGNGVQVAYRQGNWSEGLTTFMADYGLAVSEGPEAARQMRLSWLRDYAALPEQDDSPIRSFVAKRHQASQIIGYNKAAFLFHMLKNRIGEAAFSSAIQRFWSEQKFRIAGWSDLQTAFETESDQDLGVFFRQWLERTGAPALSVADFTVSRTDEGYVTEFVLAQAEPAYELKVPVEVVTDRETVYAHIDITSTATKGRLVTADKPERLRIDPGYDLFRRLLPGESPPIFRDVTLARAVSVKALSEDEGFLEAATQLAGRLLGTAGEIERSEPGLPDGPVIVLGTPERLAGLVAEEGLSAAPERSDEATAVAWVSPRADSAPVILVAARDRDAMSALIRPLPHYGRQSYVVFSGRKAVARGVWPGAGGPLDLSLETALR